MSAGKRKAVVPPMEQSDEALKKQLRAEGWRFSSDAPAAAAAQIQGPPDEVGEKLIGMVVQNGRLAVDEIVKTLASDARPLVQAHGCEALAMLAENDTALSNLSIGEGEAAVLQGFGLDAVLVAIFTHPTDAVVQLKACGALGNIGSAVGWTPSGSLRAVGSGKRPGHLERRSRRRPRARGERRRRARERQG